MWTEKQKFWNETWRTATFAVLGFLLTLWIVEPFKDKSLYQAEIDREKLSIKAKVVDDFLAKSYDYTAIAYDALRNKELNGVDTLAEREFKGAKRDSYRDLTNRISVYFESTELNRLIFESKKTDTLLFNCYNNNSSSNIWRPLREKLKIENNNIAIWALKDLKMLKK